MSEPDRGASVALTPAEDVALTIALAQLQRGEQVTEGLAAMCVLGLARIARGFDYGGLDDGAQAEASLMSDHVCPHTARPVEHGCRKNDGTPNPGPHQCHHCHDDPPAGHICPCCGVSARTLAEDVAAGLHDQPHP